MSKNIWIVIFSLVANLSIGFCSQILNISGYYENQIRGLLRQGSSILKLRDYNKLRLNFDAKINENINFKGSYFLQTIYGYRNFNLLELIPEKFASQVQDRSIYDVSLSDTYCLDRAYLTVDFKHVKLFVGRQLIFPWGVGYGWSPSDVFNVIVVTDPSYELRGFDAIRFEVLFGNKGTFTALLALEDRWENCIKVLKLKESILNLEVSGSFVEKNWAETNYLTNTQSTPKQRLYCFDFSGQLHKKIKFWGEFAYNDVRDFKNFWKYVLGTGYFLEDEKTFVVAEYYRNELGRNNKDEYTFNDWMGFLYGENDSLGSSSIIVGAGFPLTETIGLFNHVIMNLCDRSMLINPLLNFNLSKNLKLSFYALISTGDEESENGSVGHGIFGRIKVSF